MPVVPTLPAVTGGVYTTSQVSQTVSAVKFLRNPPVAQLRQTVAQSLSNFATVNLITFDAEDFDDDVDGIGGHSTSSNTSRYTARYAGRYEVGGGVAFAGNTTGRRWAWLRINGVDVNGSQVALVATSASDIAVPVRTTQLYLAQGDYLEMACMQDSGGALNTYVGSGQATPSMSVRWVSI